MTTDTVAPLPVYEPDILDDWSPDGTTLAVMTGDCVRTFPHPTLGPTGVRDIDLLRTDGTGRERFTTAPNAYSLKSRFSPDGKSLAFRQTRSVGGQIHEFAVVRARDGSPPRDLHEFKVPYPTTQELHPFGPPCWSPDGTSFSWVVRRRRLPDGENRPDLLRVALETGKVTHLNLATRGLTWVQSVDWR